MTFPTRKAKSNARGYGQAHKAARAAAAKRHSPNHPCARCDHPLGPMGSWLHWDHNDQRTGYLGFSHGSKPCATCGRRCNIQDAAQAGRAKSNGGPAVTITRIGRW
jgi:hypothetical protein